MSDQIPTQRAYIFVKNRWHADTVQKQWKLWSGPWKSEDEARGILARDIQPHYPDRRFAIVGELPGMWGGSPDYTVLANL